MCGIVGFINRSLSASAVQKTIYDMTQQLTHRGPDDVGYWICPSQRIALGHRRLSIVDLSPTGRQPMMSKDGRFQIVFNGEIYNHPDIRQQLMQLGVVFSGHSDTEVLLAAIAQWGLAHALRKTVGMFAIAVYDRQTQTLSLARDRLGIKPLYYALLGDTLLFASELKAFHAHPRFHGRLNEEALTLYARYGYLPSPQSIYQQVFKLPPATFAVLPVTGDLLAIQPTAYWQVPHHADKQGCINEIEAPAQLQQLIDDAVRLRIDADVPVGAFLSGGIDSSLVVASMQSQSKTPVHTFSIGFENADFNEAAYAEKIATHLGTAHTALYVTADMAREILPELAYFYDEPFADASQIPTYFVSAVAKKTVTVTLSGDGGDELFAGYNRYQWFEKWWGKIDKTPLFLRQLAASILSKIPFRIYDTVSRFFNIPQMSHKAYKLAELLSCELPQQLYQRMISQQAEGNYSEIFLKKAGMPWQINTALGGSHLSFVERMMLCDLLMYLPDDILCKLDRASMAFGLEARVPLLDHRIVEFAWQLPMSQKIRFGQTKWILREVLKNRVPAHLFERTKMGFAVPLAEWLRTVLRDWAHELLATKKLAHYDFFDVKHIQTMWQMHLAGKSNYHTPLWNILMLMQWLERYG